VGEHEDAVPAKKAGSVDNVGAPLDDQLDQLRELFRRVFEIGVLDDDEVAGYFLETAPKRRSLATVDRLEDHLDRQFRREPGQDLTRSVLRAVIDNDEFRADRYGDDTPDHLLDRRLFVVCRHDNRQQRIGELPLQTRHQRAVPVEVRYPDGRSLRQAQAVRTIMSTSW